MRYALILAGGSGTRLWPMSRNEKPKQLIPFIRGRSLLSLAYGRLEGLVDQERRLVCAGETLRQSVYSELPELTPDRYLGEPDARDTLPALCFGAAVIAKRDPVAVVGVFTADHLIDPEDRFREAIEKGFRLAEEDAEILVTFGIAPTYPATGFGYLRLGGDLDHGSRRVTEFKEKPDAETAGRYVSEGPGYYLWNSGMFVWRASTFLDRVRRYEPRTYEGASRIADAWGADGFPAALNTAYPGMKRTSVDFAVMEPASRDPRVKVAAVPMDLSWLDVGSWPAFALTCQGDTAGNSVAAEKSLLLDSSGTLVVSSDPDHLVAALGCRDLFIIHTPEATLVCRKDNAEDIKKLHDLVAERFGPRFA